MKASWVKSFTFPEILHISVKLRIIRGKVQISSVTVTNPTTLIYTSTLKIISDRATISISHIHAITPSSKKITISTTFQTEVHRNGKQCRKTVIYLIRR